MRRREFIAALGGIVAVPVRARAQGERVRRIGILLAVSPDDTEFRTWIDTFLQTLAQLGWAVGRNISVETRWGKGSAAEIRKHVSELIALAPDVILAHGSSTVGPLLQATRTVPVVFPIVGDPVGAGFVESLAQPGGNATGFLSTEFSMGAKWLELLKEIAPHVRRVGVLRETAQGSGTNLFAAIQAVAPSLGIEIVPISLRDVGETERGLTAFARSPNGGLILTPGPATLRHRGLIISLAVRHNLPTVYYERFFVAGGGLVAYERISSITTGGRRVTSTAFSRVKSPPICRCRHRTPTSSRSI